MPRADRTPKADRRYGAGAHTAAARRTIRAQGLLRQIEERRQQRDRADLAVRASEASEDDRTRLRGAARTAQQALDTAVMMALADRRPPPDQDIAAAAGADAYELEHVRQRLGGTGPPRR